MIRNETQYQEACERIKQDREVALAQRQALVEAGFTPEEVERGMEPLLSFNAALAEEIEWYENVRRHNFAPLRRLTDIGRTLIALRIANDLSQRELANRLGVSEASVSRDERNEYHGITMEHAQRIMDALQATIVGYVEEYAPTSKPELIST